MKFNYMSVNGTKDPFLYTAYDEMMALKLFLDTEDERNKERSNPEQPGPRSIWSKGGHGAND